MLHEILGDFASQEGAADIVRDIQMRTASIPRSIPFAARTFIGVAEMPSPCCIKYPVRGPLLPDLFSAGWERETHKERETQRETETDRDRDRDRQRAEEMPYSVYWALTLLLLSLLLPLLLLLMMMIIIIIPWMLRWRRQRPQ